MHIVLPDNWPLKPEDGHLVCDRRVKRIYFTGRFKSQWGIITKTSSLLTL